LRRTLPRDAEQVPRHQPQSCQVRAIPERQHSGSKWHCLAAKGQVTSTRDLHPRPGRRRRGPWSPILRPLCRSRHTRHRLGSPGRPSGATHPSCPQRRRRHRPHPVRLVPPTYDHSAAGRRDRYTKTGFGRRARSLEHCGLSPMAGRVGEDVGPVSAVVAHHHGGTRDGDRDAKSRAQPRLERAGQLGRLPPTPPDRALPPDPLRAPPVGDAAPNLGTCRRGFPRPSPCHRRQLRTPGLPPRERALVPRAP
jgi:hypothetical protein